MSSERPRRYTKPDRTHEENQERAYIAASRRNDRSLGARLESARRASEIHKKRTGRGFKITEETILNDELYEEEDPEFGARLQRLQAALALESTLQNNQQNPSSFRPPLNFTGKRDPTLLQSPILEQHQRLNSFTFPVQAGHPSSLASAGDMNQYQNESPAFNSGNLNEMGASYPMGTNTQIQSMQYGTQPESSQAGPRVDGFHNFGYENSTQTVPPTTWHETQPTYPLIQSFQNHEYHQNEEPDHDHDSALAMESPPVYSAHDDLQSHQQQAGPPGYVNYGAHSTQEQNPWSGY